MSLVLRALRDAACACCAVLVSCAAPIDDSEAFDTVEQPVAGASAAGVVPSGLPPRLAIGLFSDTGDNWMRDSGVRWDVRYRYFTKGWVNNWGWGASDGSWGLAYMRECDQQNFIPAIQYYQMHDEPGGGEAQFLQKAQNATTMRSYFSDFKLLMQRTKDFGKPVVVLLEADGTGLLQQQTNGNPNTYAAVAATGLPELAGLPNTVAGWGLAFLRMRAAVGANNTVLGLHVSAWASGKDIAHFDVTEPLGPEVTKVHGFLSGFGLATNVTGQTYDVLVGDPLDRDADFYRLTQNQNRWWDASDSAPIASRSFNRYAEWMRLWNQATQRRWILWQIPLGNSNHLNVTNNGGARQGYKDNRPEYFFGSGTAHLTKFADAGAIALLFGAGAGGLSWYTNDYYTDGQLFMKSRAGAILNAGGVPIATGSGGSTTCSPIGGTGSGLTGHYYATQSLPAPGTAPTLARTDARVDFAWGSAAPAPGLPADRFSVRWTGKVQPRFTGTYTFFTTSDDGVRLSVNGRRLIDNWTDHPPTENSGTIQLVAGTQYDIVLEYYEATGGATVRLSWSSGCEPKAVIPGDQLYPAASAPTDNAAYDFESGVQGWTSTGGMITRVASSAARAYAGARALAVHVNGTGKQRVFVRQPATPAGRTVTLRFYVPVGVSLASVQPYVLQGAAGGWAWTGNWTAGAGLQAGAWNTLTVAVPPASATPLHELGLELTLNSSANTTFYLDAVSW